MCNLYGHTSNAQAIIDLVGTFRNLAGNLEPQPGIYPDYAAPIVRIGADGVRELVMSRWGMPSPAFALRGRSTDPGVTNIRNTSSPHWRRWLGVEHRCVVPFTAFSEYEAQAGKKVPVWFELSHGHPLAVFAGLWCSWTSVRRKAEGEVTADLFGFLTCVPSQPVRDVHPKAMPVILTEPGEIEAWLTAPWAEARTLQRPMPDGTLQIVARGEQEDGQ